MTRPKMLSMPSFRASISCHTARQTWMEIDAEGESMPLWRLRPRMATISVRSLENLLWMSPKAASRVSLVTETIRMISSRATAYSGTRS